MTVSYLCWDIPVPGKTAFLFGRSPGDFPLNHDTAWGGNQQSSSWKLTIPDSSSGKLTIH